MALFAMGYRECAAEVRKESRLPILFNTDRQKPAVMFGRFPDVLTVDPLLSVVRRFERLATPPKRLEDKEKSFLCRPRV
jgi:hypothetical protein